MICGCYAIPGMRECALRPYCIASLGGFWSDYGIFESLDFSLSHASLSAIAIPFFRLFARLASSSCLPQPSSSLGHSHPDIDILEYPIHLAPTLAPLLFFFFQSRASSRPKLTYPNLIKKSRQRFLLFRQIKDTRNLYLQTN